MSPDERPPAPSEAERPARLDAELQRAAGDEGFLPFDRFMEIALYSETSGYYARPSSPLGTRGDFYTAAHVHPLFGQTIAHRLDAVRRAVPGRGPFRVVELGAGDGTLGTALLPALSAREGPGTIEYVIVERSRSLRDRTLARLDPVARAAGIALSAMGSVGAEGPFTGAVVANEVLDAQPARRLRWTGLGWHELGVRKAGDRWIGAQSDPVTAVPGPPLPQPRSPGTIVEISPMAEGLVREIGDHLTGGLALLIDYGMEETELLAAHPAGTLSGVRSHQPVPDPFDRPGETDLSVFVNFDRIRAAAARAGLVEIAYRSQAESLGAWGFPALRDAALRNVGSSEAEVRLRLTVKNLLYGFERFRVLELAAPLTADAVRSAT